MIIQGDCLDIIPTLEPVDLIYMDPPFGKNSCDKQFGLHWKSLDDYIKWLKPRVQQCYDVLKDTGSLYLHCDWHANHHIRLMLDRVFGEKNFRNEIVYRSTNSPKTQSKVFGTQHETIFYYTKSNDFTFNKIKIKNFNKKYLKQFRYDDNDGRGPYQTVAIVAGGVQRYNGRKTYDFKGFNKMWLYSKDTMEELYNDNRLKKSEKGFRKKMYLSEVEGTLLSDFWCDDLIKPKQRPDYPTEKPLSVLNRIISVSTNKGDIVLDPMAGGGTTVISAQKLGRKYIGIDINKKAIDIAKERLKD